MGSSSVERVRELRSRCALSRWRSFKGREKTSGWEEEEEDEEDEEPDKCRMRDAKGRNIDIDDVKRKWRWRRRKERMIVGEAMAESEGAKRRAESTCLYGKGVLVGVVITVRQEMDSRELRLGKCGVYIAGYGRDISK